MASITVTDVEAQRSSGAFAPECRPSPDGVHAEVVAAQSQGLRSYAVCDPRYFDVTYRINPWMDPTRPTDASVALVQWRAIVDAYLEEGHQVHVISPLAGLPDMVFTANAGIAIGSKALLARFRHPERSGEEAPFRTWFEQAGYEVAQASFYNEGEGDYAVAGSLILGASGFRTDRRSHAEVSDFFGLPVIALELCDERFYHLDTALAVLGPQLVAYWPGAFTPAGQGVLRELFPDAVLAGEADAVAFGLNACSDGKTVVMAAGALHLATQLRERGLRTKLLDTSELQRSGGSVKCCTLELRGSAELRASAELR